MTLAEQLYHMMQQNQKAMQLTDLEIGTVVSADPLEISINAAMAPLRREVLYLTAAVVEKKIPVLEHVHSISVLTHSHSNSAGSTTSALTGSYDTDKRLTDIAVTENGTMLPVEDGYIILNRGLQVGDSVLILRVQQGQKFVVLSRVYQ